MGAIRRRRKKPLDVIKLLQWIAAAAFILMILSQLAR